MKVFVLCIAAMVATNMVFAEPCDENDNTCVDDGGLSTRNVAITLAVAFEKYLIVPDFVDTAPKFRIDIVYETVEVNLGNKINAIYTLLPPYINCPDADPRLNYTYLLLSADVPTRAAPTLRFRLLSGYVNVNGSEVGDMNGFPVAPYVPPTPSPKSGYHRVVALLFEQTAVIDTTDPGLVSSGVHRLRFNLTDFSINNKLGDLAAGNFWQTYIPDNYERCCSQ